VSACIKCGHDPEAKVLRTWCMELDMPLKSLNRHAVNFGAARFAYRKERDAWQWLIKREVLRWFDLHKATTKRRVTIKRLFAGRCRAFDQDNLVGAAKIVVDALKNEGVVKDDSQEWLELHVQQEKWSSNATIVLVEELA
jgi:Holliday junction resolvase RusA-like endonuclease